MSELGMINQVSRVLRGADKIQKDLSGDMGAIQQAAKMRAERASEYDSLEPIDHTPPTSSVEPDKPVMKKKYHDILTGEGFKVDNDASTRQGMGIAKALQEIHKNFKSLGNEMPQGALSFAESVRISPRNERTIELFNNHRNANFDGIFNGGRTRSEVGTIRTKLEKDVSDTTRIFQHEWFHALDNNLWKTYQRGDARNVLAPPFASKSEPRMGEIAFRKGLRKSWDDLHERVVEFSDGFYSNAEMLDNRRRLIKGLKPDDEYFTKESEMLARAFDAYMTFKRSGKAGLEGLNRVKEGEISPFPSVDEMEDITPLFDEFFKKLKPIKQEAPGQKGMKPSIAGVAGASAATGLAAGQQGDATHTPSGL